MTDERRTVPGDVVDAFMFKTNIVTNDVDVEARINELEEQIDIVEQRLIKAKTKMNQLGCKRKGANKAGHSMARCENTDKRIANLTTKVTKLYEQLLAYKREYAAMWAVKMELPLNFTMNSLAYRKDGELHFLLGYFDEQIGKNHHGHFVFSDDGKCVYARFPFEAHGRRNVMRPPKTIFEMLQKNFDRAQLLAP